ncbi:hypothetical protein VHEMI08228 [[Torrubiella] hemipterigena]|nr:hypothetical protein VHEMI08228 [[Torrubiella] hemipterigena]
MKFALLSALAAVAVAHRPWNAGAAGLLPEGPVEGNTTEGFGKLEYFDQLIDHSNPSLGTFKQRYWWNIDHYGGPNSPIVLESPGESAVATDGDLYRMTNRTLPGLLAQDNQGAYIRIEHRYFGPSTPFNGLLNTETLQHLTLDNAVQDLVYFARNVVFPFDKTNGKATKPDQAPWLLSGCSYSGALSAWTHALSPGTFWAHEAGSAVVQAVEQFSDFFIPIKNFMPKNCTADVQKVIAYTDKVLLKGSESEKKALKTKFSVGNYTDSHFSKYISDWLSVVQPQQVYYKTNALHTVCDFVENQLPKPTVPKPGAEGVGLELALDGLARGYDWLWNTNQFPEDDVTPEVNSWEWFLCNEP